MGPFGSRPELKWESLALKPTLASIRVGCPVRQSRLTVNSNHLMGEPTLIEAGRQVGRLVGGDKVLPTSLDWG